jgi:hypothetical protein
MPAASQPQTAVQKAISKAKSTTRWAVGMCDNFVANMYGFSSSGYATALANWNATPANLKHPGDMQAPAGALMYWGGGDGHVALSTGDGNIVSTDIGGNGTVTTAPASAITSKWGKSYLGWSYPYFQGKEATNALGSFTGSTSATNAEQAGALDSINPDNIAKGFVSEITKPFQMIMSMFIWGAETLAGLVLIGLGIYITVRIK